MTPFIPILLLNAMIIRRTSSTLARARFFSQHIKLQAHTSFRISLFFPLHLLCLYV